MNSKLKLYHNTEGWIATNSEIYSSSRHRALEIICREVANVMNVDRVGIWFYTLDNSAIYEEITFNKNNTKTHGIILKKSDHPYYFNKILKERILAVDDVYSSEALSDLIESYYRPSKILSMMDSPIFSDGNVIGIVSFETITRAAEWDILDMNFAASITDTIGRLIETEKRHTYEKELRHRINYLENDLKKKLDDLNEATFSLDLALESAQIGKWDWRITTNELLLNKTWFTKLNYEPNELSQTIDSFMSVIHPEDRERVLYEINAFVDNPDFSYESRYRMITKGGDIQWCLDRGRIIEKDKDGNALRMIGVNVNITPLIHWKESLLVSEQQLKSMIESLPVPVAMFDKDFNYLAFSTKWVEQWTRLGEAKEGKPVSIVLPRYWQEFAERALSGEVITKDEDNVSNEVNGDLWLRWTMQPWRNINQAIGGIVVMAENISSRKIAEMQLAQASKFSALGEMAGGIAHEINNPLSIIKGYVDLLKRNTNRKTLTPESLAHYIEKIDTTTGRISKIVNGMRRFSRESSMDEKVVYSLNKIMEETLDICLEKINNNGTTLEVKYLATGEDQILCRPVEISQVILNLINNSFQAGVNFPHPWIRICIEESNSKFIIKVSDCGDKIPLKVRPKLFQPFFTTKDVGVGTGLGLSISRGIIEEHGGKIFFQEEAVNTTFVIELPKLNKVSTQTEL